MKVPIIPIIILAAGCTANQRVSTDMYPDIFPDYIGVTVPEGIARLDFELTDGQKFKTSIRKEGDIDWVTVTTRTTSYAEFPIYRSKDEIDPYIAYRLIEPGYEGWHDMGLYQRELSSYRETPIVTNKENNGGCVNCHNFDSGNPDRFIFHARGAGGGTVFVDGESVRIQNLAETGPQKQGAYPAWHPGGRYLAFSSNKTEQCFSLTGTQPIEVYDNSSDIIIYDTETGEVITHPAITGTPEMETFPAWSPDGRTLYFCCADSTANVAQNRGGIRYSIDAIDFMDGMFADSTRTIWQSDSLSASFPRVSGNVLMFTAAAYATFPIWHREADLWVLNLASGEAEKADILNSDDTESYHSWSSNGRWVIFSSRRIDGRYTRLFIAHCNEDGSFDKPFLLPQKHAHDNQLRLKSYNVPEFIKGEVKDRRKEIGKLFAK